MFCSKYKLDCLDLDLIEYIKTIEFSKVFLINKICNTWVQVLTVVPTVQLLF